jgi:cytochrome oxidase Cu insertion factor (SCO1/SenC/PrrC family)
MTDNPERAQPSVPEMQREYAGSWLAMKDGVVVDARRAPYELVSALTAVWHSYGIEVEAPNPDADIIHTSVVFFIDPSGHERYIATPMDDHTAQGSAYLPAGPLASWGDGIALVIRQLIR